MSLAGCGYSSETTYPTEYRSVAVPIFKNDSFYRGLEFTITEAVIKEINLRTPYRVLPEDSAETILEGRITAVQEGTLSRSREGGVPQEVEMRVVMDLVWTDQRSGEIVRDRRGLAVVGRYLPTQPVGEVAEIGQREAAQRAARAVAAMMRAEW
jgi:hypothetical protein